MGVRNNIETIKDIIMKLNGDIHPTGSTHVDYDRSENLESYIILVSSLTEELYRVASHRNDYRESVKGMADMAFEYFENEYKVLPEHFEELEEQE